MPQFEQEFLDLPYKMSEFLGEFSGLLEAAGTPDGLTVPNVLGVSAPMLRTQGGSRTMEVTTPVVLSIEMTEDDVVWGHAVTLKYGVKEPEEEAVTIGDWSLGHANTLMLERTSLSNFTDDCLHRNELITVGSGLMIARQHLPLVRRNAA